MDQVTVAYIRNVLNPLETREVHRLPALRTVPEYVREICGEGIEGYEIVASVNGCEFLPGQMELYVVAPGDSLAFCAMPQGGGSGKAIFSIVAMIAIMVVAPYAGAALAGYGGAMIGGASAVAGMTGTVLYAVGYGAVLVAGGLLISSMAPRPDTPATEESKAPTYSWDNIGNSIREGGTLPELFGTCRVVPPLIGTYVDTSGDKHFMNLLFAVAGHRVDDIDTDSIRINGSPITDFAGISTEVRLGADTQAVVQNFKDSHSDQPIQLAMKSFVITGITKANPCVVTAPGHTYSVGETIFIDEVAGAMGANVNGNTYKVGGIAADTFHLHTEADVDVDSTGWGNYGGGGYAAKWVVGQTSGDVDEIVYGISFPKGIWYANDNGSLATLTPQMLLQYKKHTDSVWTSCIAITTEPITVAVPRWYCGHFVYGHWPDGTYSKFVSIITGSTTPGDHVEGAVNYDYPVVEWQGGDSVYEVTTYPEWWHWCALNEKVEEGTPLAQPEFGVPESKQSTLYYAFATGRLTRDTYDVRVRRANAYPATSRYCADATFEYLQDVLSDDLTFPGVALFSLRALATDQLSGGMPRVDIKASRNIVWVWTGSGYEAKSASNPAWVCYQIIHRARRLDDGATFVVEGVPHDRIDYPGFLAWANYCTDTTPPVVAKTIHLYMSQTQTLRKQLNTASLLGRAVVVQIGSKFTVLVDKLDSTVQRFSFGMGNIVKDSYVEEFIPYDDRANAVEITYYDEDRDYEPTTVELYAFDFDTSDREINKATVALYGCVDRDMALQYGKWLLNNNRLLTMVASWEAGVDAIACLPGDVVEVSHDVNLFGYSGRIESATTSTAVVDRDLTYVTNCQITVRHQDDDSLETKYISSIVGRIVNISGTWAKTPAAFANYVFSTPTTNSKKFRVLDISRESELTYRIKGIEYDPNVYSDFVTVPPEAPPTDLKKVANLIATEVWRSDAGIGLSHVSLAWGGYAMRWNVWYRINNLSGWRWLGETTKPSFLAENLPWGYTYTFAVSGDSSNMAEGATVEINLYGKGSLPGEGLPVEVPVFDEARCSFTDKVYLAWAAVSESGIVGYELRRGTDWATGVVLFRGDATSFVWNSYDEFPTTASFTFHLKTYDVAGLYCAGEDSLILSVAVPAAPSSVSVEASYGKIVVTWGAISDPIVVGVEVWRSESNNRAGAILQAVIGGNSYVDAKGIVSGATYYYWLRAKTKYGTYSLWSAGDTSGHNDGVTPPIDTGDIADSAISKIKLATNLVPPEVVTSLPTLPDANYPIGMIVFLTTDGKLYRNYGNVWTKAVAVDDFDRNLGWGDIVINHGSNLIPNGTSEQGSLVAGMSPESDNLVEEPPNAYAGNWCRKFVATAGQDFMPTGSGTPTTRIQVVAGKLYEFSSRVKCTLGGATFQICIGFYDKDGDWVSGTLTEIEATASYQLVTTSGAVPAGATTLLFYYHAVDAGTYYIDEMVGWEVIYTEVADGSITQAKMASGLIPPRIVTSLPSLPDSEFPEGIIVYLTTDGKLYRNKDEAWTAEIYTDDLDRLIAGADIAADSIAVKHLIVADWTNAVPNPIFLNGNTDKWTIFGGSAVVTKGSAGVPSGAPTDYVCGIAFGTYIACPNYLGIDGSAGEEYYISAECAPDASVNGNVVVQIACFDSSGGFITAVTGGIRSGGSQTWTKVGGIVVLPANTVSFVIVISNNATAGVWYLTQARIRKAAGASLIVDGAISADKIAANAITAGKILAGAVGADAIAANVILAKHMVVADFSNILMNPEFEDFTVVDSKDIPDKWNVTPNVYRRAKDYSGVPTDAPQDFVMEYGGTSTANTGSLVTFPVTEGETYFCSVWMATGAGTNTNGSGPYFYVTRHDESVVGVGIFSGPTNANSAWQKYSGQATMPANAKTASLVIQREATTGTAKHYATQAVVRRAGNAELIVDGAIQADHIAANSVAVKHLVVADYTNMCSEGDFEAAGNQWNLVYGASVVADSTAPPKGHAMDILGPASGGYNKNEFPVKTGDTYFVSAYGYRFGTPTKDLFIWLRVTDSSAGVTWYYTGLSKTTAAGVWTRFSARITVDLSNARFAQVVPGLPTDAAASDHWRIAHIECRRAVSGELIVDGAVTADKILANTITAGQIAVGAVGADEIASDTIIARHLVIANFGSINIDPGLKDSDAWGTEGGSVTFQTISDGVAGNRSVRNTPDVYTPFHDKKYYPIDPSKSYRISFRARADGVTGRGVLYSCLRQYKDAVGTYCDTNGGRSPYKGAVNQSAHTNWVYYSGLYTPADWQTNCRFIRLDFLLNYYDGGHPDHNGYWELQNIQVMEAVDTNLIVDGTITAAKLTANHLSAVNTESGTFQQTYTAPGDNNTTPGAGMKITAGKIEAYGGDQTFGGTIMSSDGNYTVSIGKFLTATGLTKRYPLNNATNFTADGRVHIYKWVTSAWVQVASIGGASSVDYVAGRFLGYNGDWGIYTSGEGVTSIGIKAYSDSGYGGVFQSNALVTGYGGPLCINPGSSASAPSHTANAGTLWVTSAGILYINTNGSTWTKVGAQ
jgi:hypothetical protein